MSIRDCVRRFVEHIWFYRFVVGVILAIVVALVVNVSGERSALFALVLRIGLGLLVVDIVLRILAYGLRYFHDPVSVFDLVVVAVAFVPGAMPLLALRFLTTVPTMRRVALVVTAAFPGLVSVGLFVVLIIFVGGLIATSLFGPLAPQYFDDLGTSLLTLFQAMTGEGWPDVARAVMNKAPIAWTFFVVYIVLSTIVLFNLLIAVFVEGMWRTSETEERIEERIEELLHEMRKLREEVAALRVHGRE
jgi:voltage-gated sodium channel